MVAGRHALPGVRPARIGVGADLEPVVLRREPVPAEDDFTARLDDGLEDEPAERDGLVEELVVVALSSNQ